MDKKTARFVVPLIVIVFGLMVLAGCGGGSSSSTATRAYFNISGSTVSNIQVYTSGVGSLVTGASNNSYINLSPGTYDFTVMKLTGQIIPTALCLTGSFTVQSGKTTNVTGYCP